MKGSDFTALTVYFYSIINSPYYITGWFTIMLNAWFSLIHYATAFCFNRNNSSKTLYLLSSIHCTKRSIEAYLGLLLIQGLWSALFIKYLGLNNAWFIIIFHVLWLGPIEASCKVYSFIYIMSAKNYNLDGIIRFLFYYINSYMTSKVIACYRILLHVYPLFYLLFTEI